jgi:hypothetical protein
LRNITYLCGIIRKWRTAGREDGVIVIKGEFDTLKEALDLANKLNREYPHRYYDYHEVIIN